MKRRCFQYNLPSTSFSNNLPSFFIPSLQHFKHFAIIYISVKARNNIIIILMTPDTMHIIFFTTPTTPIHIETFPSDYKFSR